MPHPLAMWCSASSWTHQPEPGRPTGHRPATGETNAKATYSDLSHGGDKYRVRVTAHIFRLRCVLLPLSTSTARLPQQKSTVQTNTPDEVYSVTWSDPRHFLDCIPVVVSGTAGICVMALLCSVSQLLVLAGSYAACIRQSTMTSSCYHWQGCGSASYTQNGWVASCPSGLPPIVTAPAPCHQL